MKKYYARPIFFEGCKALVMVTLPDSFRIWPPSLSTTLWRDFQKAAETFAFPHNRLKWH